MKKIIKYSTFSLLLCVGIASHAQLTKAVQPPFALTKARVETVTNGIIVNGTILISEDGKISKVGTAITIPSNLKTINCKGLTVYPGMIDGGTQLGLVEVGSDPRTKDNNEIGNVVPHIQALTTCNPSQWHYYRTTHAHRWTLSRYRCANRLTWLRP